MDRECLADLLADLAERVEATHRVLNDHGHRSAAQLPIGPVGHFGELRYRSKRIEPERIFTSGGLRPISDSATVVSPQPDRQGFRRGRR